MGCEWLVVVWADPALEGDSEGEHPDLRREAGCQLVCAPFAQGDGTTAARPRRSSSCATGNQLVGPTSGLWTRTNANSCGRLSAIPAVSCWRARRLRSGSGA